MTVEVMGGWGDEDDCPGGDSTEKGFADHDMDLFGCRQCGAEWTRPTEIEL